jgi:hypothetical protein
VARVGKDLDEVVVSPNAAAVLRRTSPAAGEASGAGGAGLRRGDVLDKDVVFPVVAEVVGVAEPVAGVGSHLAEPLGGSVADAQVAVSDTVSVPPALEGPHVVVLPAEGSLDDVVQLAQGDA